MRSHHLAIKAQDVERVGAFYRDVLQLDAVAAPRDGVVWLRAGELLLMIEPVAAGPASAGISGDDAGLHLIAFTIEPHERAYWEVRLRDHGITVVSRSDHTLYIRDPEGNRVGLSHYPNPAT